MREATRQAAHKVRPYRPANGRNRDGAIGAQFEHREGGDPLGVTVRGRDAGVHDQRFSLRPGR